MLTLVRYFLTGLTSEDEHKMVFFIFDRDPGIIME